MFAGLLAANAITRCKITHTPPCLRIRWERVMSDEQPPRAPEAPPTRNRRTLLPSSGFLRFVAPPGARARAARDRDHARRLPPHPAVPSDPGTANLGEQAAGDPAAVASFKEHYGLDKPLPAAIPDLPRASSSRATSASRADPQPGAQRPRAFIPATAELAVSLDRDRDPRRRSPIGVAAAVKHDKPVDHALRVVSLGGISMPTFWIALVSLYVFFYRLGWFPGGGRLGVPSSRLRT